MKPFLDIGKSQQEIILAIILACNLLGMLLHFGLGLSDATQQESSIGQQTCEKPPCNAEHSEVRHNRHAIKTGQIRINYS